MCKPESPCLNCPDRTAECHAKCDRYADFDRAQKEWSRKVNDERLLDKEYRERQDRRTLR
jgi:hypothetical protein